MDTAMKWARGSRWEGKGKKKRACVRWIASSTGAVKHLVAGLGDDLALGHACNDPEVHGEARPFAVSRTKVLDKSLDFEGTSGILLRDGSSSARGRREGRQEGRSAAGAAV